jgi:2-aminoethylphosphonate-pyruvate transaminase
MMLLNPGPVNVSERVRQALIRPDICHRESDFAELQQGIQAKLLKAFVPGAEAEYAAILVTGSGTAAVESALMSSIPHGKRALIINNGVYGERMSQMVGLHRLGVSELKHEWTERPDPERLRLALRQHPEVHAVGMVHHETTTGLLNPGKAIAEVVDGLNRVFILDAVSALAGESIDIAGSKIYMVAGTAGKCIQGFPGVSFVLVRKGFLERMRAYPKRSLYLHLTHYVDDQGRATVPFTPAVQLYYAFDEALSELLEGPVDPGTDGEDRHQTGAAARPAVEQHHRLLFARRGGISHIARSAQGHGLCHLRGPRQPREQNFSHCQYGRRDRSTVHRVSRCVRTDCRRASITTGSIDPRGVLQGRPFLQVRGPAQSGPSLFNDDAKL